MLVQGVRVILLASNPVWVLLKVSVAVISPADVLVTGTFCWARTGCDNSINLQLLPGSPALLQVPSSV